MSSTQNPERGDLKVFTTWLEEDGIFRTVVKPKGVITLDDALQNTAYIAKFDNGERKPILVDIRQIGSITAEARDHFSMRGRKPHVSAIAILAGSVLSKIAGNFYIVFSRPVVPVRLFTREDKALAWLKNFL